MVDKEIVTGICPNCNNSIPFIGASYYLHLNQCDPNHSVTKFSSLKVKKIL